MQKFRIEVEMSLKPSRIGRIRCKYHNPTKIENPKKGLKSPYKRNKNKIWDYQEDE